MSRIPPPRNPPPGSVLPKKSPAREARREAKKDRQDDPHLMLGGVKPPVHLAPIADIAKAYDDCPVTGTTAPNITELIRQAREESTTTRKQSVPRVSGKNGPKVRASHRRNSGSGSTSSALGLGPTVGGDEEDSSSMVGGLHDVRQSPPKRSKGEMMLRMLDRAQQELQGAAPSSSPAPLPPPPAGAGGHMRQQRQSAPPLHRLTSPTPSSSLSPVSGVSPHLGPSLAAPLPVHQRPSAGGFGSGASESGNGNSLSYTTTTTTAAAPGGASEFGIVVAVRVRPFNRKEVDELMNEQARRRQNPTLSASARLASTFNRHKERQPFGPGHDDIYSNTFNGGMGDTNNGFTTTSNGEVISNPLENCDLGMLLDDSGNPVPVVDVGSDGHTLTLLNPHQNAGGNVSSQFSFDHIFSSFAPSIEIMGLMDGTMGSGPRLGDTVDLTGGAPMMPQQQLLCGLEVDMTPELEQQAEAEQVSIFQTLGLPLIDSALQGYNACIFAYGQTSSGKTYTMMGTKKHRGVIPRLCHELFHRVEEIRSRAGPDAVTIDVCYMEIYNEKVRDLLKQRPKNAILHYKSRFDTKDVDYQEYQTLKVRNNPERGVFVDGLTTVSVRSWEDCAKYLRQGDALRTQASTAMNATSSRSHAIFQLVVTQIEGTGSKYRGKQVNSKRFSKMNLVDLAGSERNSKAESMGKHLQEANSINNSLSKLRRVIEGIVTKQKVIPYRESLLTYVLSDNFGGNSKTVMCANVSPHAVNYAETDSTLRYATIAKDVLNRAKVNENPTARIIHELKERVRALNEALVAAPSVDILNAKEVELRQCHERMAYMEERERELVQQLEASEDQKHKILKGLKKKQTQEDNWRKEAERQRKQKDKLRNAFRLLAKAHPDMVKEVLEDAMGRHDSPSVEDRAGGSSGRRRRSSSGSKRNSLGNPVGSSGSMNDIHPMEDEDAEGGGGNGQGSSAIRQLQYSSPRNRNASSSSLSPPRQSGQQSKQMEALRSLQKFRGIGAPLSLTAQYAERERRKAQGAGAGGGGISASSSAPPGHLQHPDPPQGHGHGGPSNRRRTSTSKPKSTSDVKEIELENDTSMTGPPPTANLPTRQGHGSSGQSLAQRTSNGSCYHTEAFLHAIQSVDQSGAVDSDEEPLSRPAPAPPAMSPTTDGDVENEEDRLLLFSSGGRSGALPKRKTAAVPLPSRSSMVVGHSGNG